MRRKREMKCRGEKTPGLGEGRRREKRGVVEEEEKTQGKKRSKRMKRRRRSKKAMCRQSLLLHMLHTSHTSLHLSMYSGTWYWRV